MSNFAFREPASGVIEVAKEASASSAAGSDGTLAQNGTRPGSMAGVVGVAPAMVALYEMVDRVAATTCAVLITGEGGTGKRLVARALHDASPRRDGPFVVVDCGAVGEAMLERALFGYVRRGLAAANATKLGRIAAAEGGTLVFDDVGALSLSLQVKLLRMLTSQEYSPLGETRATKADLRIVAATNVDLEQAVRKGAFREDLFYRLDVIHVRVPPLNQRQDDIEALALHFVERTCKKLGRPTLGISPAVRELLMTYEWPRNVRELENAIERAVLLCPADTIEPRDLPARIGAAGAEPRRTTDLPVEGLDLRAAVETFENDLIRQALARTGWNKNQAARLLGLNRTTLVEMLKRKRLGDHAA
jgi:DNA-binding NtrC family response regulator